MRRVVIDIDEDFADVLSTTFVGTTRTTNVTCFVRDITKENYFKINKDGKVAEAAMIDFSALEDDLK